MATVDVDIGHSAEVFAGEDKSLVFTVRDVNDVIQDITGWILEFEVRLTRYTPTTVLAKSGITPSDPTNGKVTISLASNDTVGLKAGTYKYGLARTNPGAYDVTAEGDFVLRKAGSHAA